MSAPAGWYPESDTENMRWWDGTTWTEHRSPKIPTTPSVAEVPVAGSPTIPERASVEAEDSEVVSSPLASQTGRTIPSKPIAKMWKREARATATALLAENNELRGLVDKHGLRAFGEIDEYRARVEAEVSELRAASLAAAQVAESELNATLELSRVASADLQHARDSLIDVNAAIELQSVGLFDFEHPAETSAALATQLEQLRFAIKEEVRLKKAVSASTGFTFNNSVAQGRKFVSDMSKVLLRAYNAEAENAVKATRAGNLAVAQKRLTTAAEQIAKSGTMIDLRINTHYHGLRLKEIELANRHLQVLAREKEMERDRKAELREQVKAEAELKKAKETLSKERSHYLATLAALEANGDEDGAARIRAKLEDVDRAIEDVDYRAANVRAGYVYVISNLGAFGEKMVKIGMTRRLEPMDRVNELGDASVPFRFDVHALFFADDAVGIEKMLHQRFAAERVNKINLRREFFYVTPDDVLQALRTASVEVVEYAIDPAAAEFRASAAA
jgi:hypothetical protein